MPVKHEGIVLNRKVSYAIFVMWLLAMLALGAYHLAEKYYTDKRGPETAAERVVEFYSWYSYSDGNPDYFGMAARTLCPEAAGMLAYGYERDYDDNWQFTENEAGERLVLGYPGSGYLADVWSEKSAIIAGDWTDIESGSRVMLTTYNARSMAGSEGLTVTVRLRYTGSYLWQRAEPGLWCIYGIEADEGLNFMSLRY
jgi:hypothetical protein